MIQPLKVYNNITLQRFAALETEAQKALGITIQGNVGQAGHDGVILSWVYAPPNQTLSFVLLQKPFFVSVGAIVDHLDKLMSPPVLLSE